MLNPQTEEEIEAAKQRLLAYQQSVSTSSKAKKRPATGACSSGSTSKPTVNDASDSATKPKRSAPATANIGNQAAESSGTRQSSASSSTRSIQEDPTASSVYKSLFTTSEEARRQPKSHWVTFNPLYFR
ncbi:unnamed protein product [Echinostoma caproni]|uniref:Uncharacterized protein n=1 Tax=Echinostoma caproni TaxID=27848 RepID=A0A3P8AYP9_9TREM|nr:unnamed protein product [Echinostoma caproni]